MAEFVLDDILTPEEAVKNHVPCLCIVLDEDTINGLRRVKEILGFPLGALVSQSLRPFVDTFLPIADLYEQGKLTAECMPEVVKGLDSLIIKNDVAKARLDKKLKKMDKQKKINLRGER